MATPSPADLVKHDQDHLIHPLHHPWSTQSR